MKLRRRKSQVYTNRQLLLLSRVDRLTILTCINKEIKRQIHLIDATRDMIWINFFLKKIIPIYQRDKTFGFLGIDILDNENILYSIFYSNDHLILDKF